MKLKDSEKMHLIWIRYGKKQLTLSYMNVETLKKKLVKGAKIIFMG